MSGTVPQLSLLDTTSAIAKPTHPPSLLNGSLTPEAFPSPTFSHSRSRSVTTTGYPLVSPSPLSSSFLAEEHQDGSAASPAAQPTSALSQSQTRRHSRIHSRNLSIYFPRPGAISVPPIAEDGAQEIEIHPLSAKSPSVPSISLQSAPPTKAKFGEGFKFGGKPPPSTSVTESFPTLPQSDAAVSRRRGHHHRHSVSHSFFSFMDPAATSPPPSASTWDAISPFPQTTTFVQPELRPLSIPKDAGQPSVVALAFSVFQTILGGFLWTEGQRAGSLASTGLGYWVVFDAFGIFLARGSSTIPRITVIQKDSEALRVYPSTLSSSIIGLNTMTATPG